MSKYQAVKNDYLGPGVVKVERVSDQTIIACKTINYKESNRKAKKHAEAEFKSLSQLHHPNITQFVDARWMPNQLKLYMEFYPDGTLDDLIGEKRGKNACFSESYVWSIIWQLSTALSYCHTGVMVLPGNFDEPHPEERAKGLRIYHRDIKPANVFISSRSETALDAIKLGDFGLSTILLDDQDPTTYVGTPIFKPPEISRAKSVLDWTTKCDVFSLGCTLYEICHLRHAYEDPMKSDMDAAAWTSDKYSTNLKSLVLKCIDAKPDHRPSALEITMLAHEEMKDTPQYRLAFKDHKLLLAVKQGDFDRVVQLLDEGARVYAENATDRETCLHLAARSVADLAAESRKPALIMLLVGKGAKLGARSVRGETPLHAAAGAGSGSMVQVILSQGANLRARDDKDSFAIHTAAGAGNLDALRVLLEHEEDPEVLTDGDNKMSPLHIAAENGHKEIVQCLLDKGVNTEVFRTDGKTALHLSAENGHVPVLIMLIKAGSIKNTRIKDKSGDTALHRAAAIGNMQVAESLIDQKCNTTMPNAKGETALHLAASQGHDQIVKLLIKTKDSVTAATKGDRLQALHLAAKAGHHHVVKTLLEAKADIESLTLDGETALHLASGFGRKSVVRELLAQNAQVDARGPNATTPLHLAAASGKEEVIQILLENGAKIDARTNDGMTSLHIAALYSRLKVVQVLVDSGVDMGLGNDQGETALKVARQKGHRAVVRVLADRDAPEDVRRNAFGRVTNALSQVFL